MHSVFAIAWVTGMVLVLLWLVRLAHAGRNGRIASRTTVAMSAVLIGALGTLAAYVWGAQPARSGMERIAEARQPVPVRAQPLGAADAAAAAPEPGEPPRARLFLRHVQMRLAAAANTSGKSDDESNSPPAAASGESAAVVGYSPAAALRLPRSYGLDESKQGWDVLRVSARGPQGLRVSPIEHPEATGTRVVLRAIPRGAEDKLGGDQSALLARRAAALLPANRCASDADSDDDGDAGDGGGSAALDGPGAIYAILCSGATPRAALVFERDLAAAESAAAAVRVLPMVRRGRSFRPHHIQIASGSLIQIGTLADALPGVTLWEVPAPTGRAELFYPPADVLAPCTAWLTGGHGEGFFSQGAAASLGVHARAADAAAAAAANDDRAVCVLPFTPPFGLEVRRLLPDVPAVRARSLWAAGLAITPALLALLLLAAQPRGALTARRFARLLTLGWLSVLLAAVAVWRLLWAHRIDMLRDYESVGVRVLGNQVAAVLIGATLAAACVALWRAQPRPANSTGTSGAGRAGATKLPAWLSAGAAWALWLAAGGSALRGDLDALPWGPGLLLQALISLAAGTAPLWLAIARRRLGGRTWRRALLALAGVAAAALLAEPLAPRAVALKLGLSWLYPFALYAALREAVTSSGAALGRTSATLALAALAGLALARFDPGVTLVIALPGAFIALLMASHDACFGEGALRQIRGYQHHLAPLAHAHAILLGLAGALVAGACALGLAASVAGEPDATAARALTQGAMHALLLGALLLVPAGALAQVRRGARAALPWLVAAALLAALWLLRAPLIDRVLESSAQAAHRLAIVLDPGYALLHSETKFLAGLTAWRETILPAAEGSARTWSQLFAGQGYFGAQLIDPGVLLSIENDYFPVLVVRETGIRGLLATAALPWLLCAAAWALASARFRHGSAAQRARVLGACTLAALSLYQPLAALGALPLTGVAWPGFGLDSPSDLWLLVILALWLLLWETRAPRDRARAEEEAHLEAFDVTLRSSRVFTRVRAVAAAAAVLVTLAGVLVLARSAAFALRRPNPVDAQGQAVAPWNDLVHAVDYAYRLECPWPRRSAQGADAAEELIPSDILGDPEVRGASRFHEALREDFLAQRGRAVAELRGFIDPSSEDTACGADEPVRAGAWSFTRGVDAPDTCRMRFKTGWPEIELAVTRAPRAVDADADEEDADPPAGTDGEREDSDDTEHSGDHPPEHDDETGADASQGEDDDANAPAHVARCEVELRRDVLRELRFPARRPYRDARIRLVSRAMGAAAGDRGELVSGHLSVRLRPGAGTVDVSQARAGLYAGETVRIAPDLDISIAPGSERPVLRRTAAPAPADARGGDSWLFVREPPEARVRVLAAEEGTWRLMPPELSEMPLDRLTLVVVGGPDARSLWLFRPPQPWSEDDPATGAVDPLLADDITTVRGERRRHYLFGGLLPELGWVNPYHARMSLGLDGWLRVATAEYERAPGPATPEDASARPARPGDAAAPLWLDRGREVLYCGTLDAAEPDPAPAAAANADGVTSAPESAAAARFGRVCRRSPLDGVLECRVSVQPELSLRLRHLTELISLAPNQFAGEDNVAPVRAGYVLLRGDTGELVAQGEFVPGRASTAYAPATPEIEQALIRLREDRDPATGHRLPPSQRGEASAEKLEWSQPVALGSTMKPYLGRALELAAPAFARELRLSGAPMADALCRRAKTHALLGHCPPTDSLWNHHGSYDMSGFLSASINWYQAAIGLLGTAVPGGDWGFGQETDASSETELNGPLWADPAWLEDSGGPAPTAGNVGAHSPERALWTSYRGRRVVSAAGTIDLGALRTTPMWQRFEELLGRTLCTAGSKGRCRRASTRRDLCAARAMPIEQPSRDLRHLVALGPSMFDFYPPLADPTKRVGPRVRTREYLQFLRGSGLHPLGSLAQASDAFGRVVYERPRDPARDGRYRLAASWFPVPAVGQAPSWSCGGGDAATPGGTAEGLCEVLRTGTARGLRPLLEDPRFRFFGAKTGTIDSLADLVENRAACNHFRSGHTVTDRPAQERAQPYWLPCGKRRAPAEINDSLLLVAMSVRTAEGEVPLTLGLRFQRSGPGFATRVLSHYLDIIHAYFNPQAAAADASATADELSDSAASAAPAATPANSERRRRRLRGRSTRRR
ncbi:hypothetical protein [Haliangium ochraceum]|uniref:Uncharacterized protein n=1 Tax=Haliangium ochraceum (strain DSM 14365 / JCM 11303 / SMP-2) TaxID=502025 RepID=D0LKE4_HALO1|nr:hypothetical protein [Haliangium ochraceum]ACY14992.1 hypothetical protein Hoch_2456 [Haliangium ochraceum DSM 14365]